MDVSIALDAGGAVSGIWLSPAKPRAALVLAHGAGAGMRHKGMAAIADGLAAREIATLRYQFPYMEKGGKRVDAPTVAHGAVRAAVRQAAALTPKLPLFAGGRSFGGRMTSQAEALEPLGVRGLVFFAFPLHPAGKPGTERAVHLHDVRTPMLFLQGDADALAEIALLRATTSKLARATLHLEAHADHSFNAPAKSGRKDGDVMESLLDAAAAWMLALT